MTTVPQAAVSERLRAEIRKWGGPEDVSVAAGEVLADGFFRGDRRRPIAMPTGDLDGCLESFDAWYEIGDGRPNFDVAEVTAARGERLVPTHACLEYASAQ